MADRDPRPVYLPANNPEKPAPIEVLREIRPVAVLFKDFDGVEQRGVIEVHQNLSDDVLDFFRMAYDLNFPIARVDIASHSDLLWDDTRLMAANVSSGFNYRTIVDTDTPSLHGLGRAFDINPLQNPYVRYKEDGTVLVEPEGAIWEPEAPGTLHANHPLVLFMEEKGWEWGGHWASDTGRTDYQHFQKAA